MEASPNAIPLNSRAAFKYRYANVRTNPNEFKRKLTPKQRQAALLLASGDTGSQVAKSVGTTP